METTHISLSLRGRSYVGSGVDEAVKLVGDCMDWTSPSDRDKVSAAMAWMGCLKTFLSAFDDCWWARRRSWSLRKELEGASLYEQRKEAWRKKAERNKLS